MPTTAALSITRVFPTSAVIILVEPSVVRWSINCAEDMDKIKRQFIQSTRKNVPKKKRKLTFYAHILCVMMYG